MIGIGLFSVPITQRCIEYFAPMKLVILSIDMQDATTDIVPHGTRQISFHQAFNGDSGKEMSSKFEVTSAVSGTSTWSNPVSEKSSGAVPARGPNRMDWTPLHISWSLQMGTMKNRGPLSSPSTINRAITTASLGIPKDGVVAGIYLVVCSVRYCRTWIITCTDFHASSLGVLITMPSGVLVAVVSMLKVSNPCPLSVMRKRPMVSNVRRRFISGSKSGL
jgi:hypothetical protein